MGAWGSFMGMIFQEAEELEKAGSAEVPVALEGEKQEDNHSLANVSLTLFQRVDHHCLTLTDPAVRQSAHLA